MSSTVRNCDFGDSARIQLKLNLKGSNHVFDGAGENIQYHSDSESVSSKHSKRYINPAIYVEKIEATHSVTSLLTDSSCVDEVTPHPHGSCRSTSTPMLSNRPTSSSSSCSVKRVSCRMPEEVEDEVTPRCNRTYREEGADTFRLSVASLSTTTTAKEERERSEQKRQEAFNAWLARKEAEQKREKSRQEKSKRQMVPTTTAQQREESYKRWLERKREQTKQRRADEVMRRYSDGERQREERERKQREKEDKLNDWIKKKEEDIKLMKTKEERKNAYLAIAEERKRVQGERAYRDWLRTSKKKPLPVPLNQGALSMRGSVSQMYINPVPWQSLI